MLRFAKIEIDFDHEVTLPFRPLRAVELQALMQLGLIDEERLELLDGSLVAMRPSINLHTIVSARIAAMLTRQLGPAWSVRQHCYLILDEISMPEPDVAVTPLARADPSGLVPLHPRPVVPAPLVVEVSDFTFSQDAMIKAMLYAEAGIPTYWLVDLVRRRVRVHEQPDGSRYTVVDDRGLEAVLTAEALPAVALPVGEVLASA